VRRNLAIFAGALVVVTVAYFLLVWRGQSGRIQDASDRADEAEQTVQRLEIELRRLQSLERDAPTLRERHARFDAAMPSDPRLAEFILQVQDAANASGIEWVSVNPAPPAAGEVTGVSNVDIQMAANGGYFQIQDFLVRLEQLERALKIRTINLSAGPTGLPNLTAALTMTMFVAGQAPAPGTGQAPAPAGSPTPTASPAAGQPAPGAPAPSPTGPPT
jgi:Tfp pilus assembly protein PilO